MMKLFAFLTLGIAARGAVARPCADTCPPFKTNGTLIVNQYQLYPENADFDEKSCLVYFGALTNASVVIYDPYANKVKDILEFPGITRNATFHLGGVAADPYSGLISILVDAAAAFVTGGKDISGDNYLIKWDPIAHKTLWKTNLTAVSGGKYGAFQDVEHDSRGNTYVVGTYPGTILRVDANGTASPWYLPPTINQTQAGFGGLANVKGTDILLSNNNVDGQIYSFDMAAAQGTPVKVFQTPTNATIGGSDAIYLPPRYNGTVLLVAVDATGVTVLRSKDAKWVTAEQLGTVPNNVPAAQGGFVTAAIEIGGSLYAVEEFFADPPIPGSTSGNRTAFPLLDITSQVEALLAK